MIDKVKKNKCVGCKACGDVCPQDAIRYFIDDEGFWYPNIDYDRCIECDVCDKVCPVFQKHSNERNRKEPKTYKSYHKDNTIRYNSTSGGVYYALAKMFIDDGGYIAGCVYDNQYTGAFHIVSNRYEDLKKIMGSKYFQSDTEDIFRKVKKILMKGNKVLFCGTPCQISALYAYLGREKENLYSIDLICRGINTPLAFEKYMQELRNKYKADIKEVHFKNKSRGWINLGTLVTFKNGQKYYRNMYNDPWVNAFLGGSLYMRPCCETCEYKGFPRYADITLGDFWGLEFTKEEKKLGVSVVLSNTEKGDYLIERAKEYLDIEEKKFNLAVKGNPALLYSINSNPKRKEFFERIKVEPYSEVVWDILKISKYKRIKNEIIAEIKNFIKNIIK